MAVAALLQVVRGASLGGLLAGGVLAVVLVLSLAPGAHRLIFVLTAVAAVVYCLIPPDDDRHAQLGAIGTVLLGVAGGAVTGFGWLEGSLVLGGLAAVFVSAGHLRFTVPVVPAAALLGTLAIVALIPLIIGGETLGHDESVYALKGLSWLEGTPDTGWSLHRGPVLSAIAYGVFSFGGGEAALRLFGLVGLTGLAAGTWWLGRRMFSSRVGALAAVVVVAGPAILRRATEFLTDIPAAALLIACLTLTWIEFERDRGPTFRLLWVLPLAWLAFYLRYQSILSLGLIGLAVLILWWPRIKDRPGPVVSSAIVGIAGLVPHALFASSETDSPTGILLATGQVAGREFLGEGIIDYALFLGWPLAGLLGPPLVVFFIWWIARAWGDETDRKRALFLAIPAIGQVLALGIVSHGEPRFVFFPLTLVAVGAVAGFLDISALWRPRFHVGARAGLAVLLVGSVVLSVVATRSSVEHRILSNEPVELAADHVELESQGAGCGVMTSYLPQVTFYSGCHTEPFRTGLDVEEAIDGLEGEMRFMILIADGKRQPEGDDLEELVDETDGQPFLLLGQRDSAVVYEFEGD